MNPGSVAGEFPEEPGCRNRAAVSPGRVLDVCDITSDQVAVFIIHRHRPESLANIARGLSQLVNECRIVSEDAYVDRAECDRYRSSECREIDYSGRSKFLGIRYGI